MRGRRRQRKNWLPISPTYWGEGVVGTTFYQSTLSFADGSENGDTVLAAVPLVLDQTQSIDTADEGVSMRDLVQGQEYILDRVVGEVWMSMEQINYQVGEPNVINALGCICLAVLPVDDANPDTIAIDPQDYHPLLAANTMAPWLWRRTWMLSNTFAAVTPFGYFPTTTGQYGGSTGGHLDTRGTKRRIRKEQRLFLIAAAAALNTSNAGTQEPSALQFGFDLRALGGMRPARNQSTFK